MTLGSELLGKVPAQLPEFFMVPLPFLGSFSETLTSPPPTLSILPFQSLYGGTTTIWFFSKAHFPKAQGAFLTVPCIPVTVLNQ